MTDLSMGANLAWKIAALEAQQAGADAIGVEHLFIGLMSMGKMVSDDTAGTVGSADTVAGEWDAILSLLEITGHDPVVLRRLMRTELKKDGVGHRGAGIIHRSPACREFFSRARRHAGGTPVTANDLFSAIMSGPTGTIAAVLAEGRRCVAADRKTDLLLPASPGLMDSDHITRQGFDLKEALTHDIRRYAASLRRWPEESPEYGITVAAIRKRAAGLIRLCLDDGDRKQLHATLLFVAPHAGAHAQDCVSAAQALEAEPAGKPLREEIRARIGTIADSLIA